MIGTLHPTAFYYTSGSSGPVPYEWQGWADLGGISGVQWITITLSSL